MLKYNHLCVILAAVFCRSLLFAQTLLYIQVNGPSSVNEESTTVYTCTAHYSNGATADVTDQASWSIPGTANTGVWLSSLSTAKAVSDAYDIPMVYVWQNSDCGYCDDFDSLTADSDFQEWMASRQLVMARVESSSIDSSTDKTFAKEGLNGSLYEYPFVAVYWPSKSSVPWNFTGRYDGGVEEFQLINEIEHYISDYSSGPANSASISVDGMEAVFVASSVSSDTDVTISVSWNGENASKLVTILDNPDPRELSSESFETGFGAWTQSDADDFDWTRKSGPTLSEGTGPSGAGDGNYYIYTEASGNYPSKTAAVEASANVSAAVSPALIFDYHMYGAETGTLYVDVHDGSSWHLAVWSVSGQQHGGYSVSWSEANVDLSAFSGNVTIRVRGVTADGYRSDMAVDNIRLTDVSGIAPYSFATWLEDESVPAGERGENDDPAGDGIANLLKYACGIPAMQYTSSAALLDIVPGATPEVFSVRYYRDPTAVDVILDPIWSEVLSGPWQTSGISKELIDTQSGIQEWRGSIPLDEAGFMRLRATSVE